MLAASQPLSDDPVAELIREAGGGNLYRKNPDGSFTLITNRPPEALESANGLKFEFKPVGMSSDCSTVLFTTRHSYAGVPGVGKEPLYEWSEAGGLRYAGWIPDGKGGEAAVEASPGSAAGGGGNRFNAVSEDGSRVFFSAKRLSAPLAGEVGKTGIFVREDGAHSTDVSASETAVPDEGAEYQGATPDGSKVYFTAKAGLTAGSSAEGTDLYQYDFGAPEGERLTDLSVAGSGPADAGAKFSARFYGSLVAVSEHGSHAYFIARARLVPGQGSTYSQNEAAGTYSLYDYDAESEALRFVGAVGAGNGDLSHVTLANSSSTTSRTSADGRYLLFESSANVTGYESGGPPEAYLYDAGAKPGEEATRCLSCRLDGKPPVLAAGEAYPYLLASSANAGPPLPAAVPGRARRPSGGLLLLPGPTRPRRGRRRLEPL